MEKFLTMHDISHFFYTPLSVLSKIRKKGNFPDHAKTIITSRGNRRPMWSEEQLPEIEKAILMRGDTRREITGEPAMIILFNSGRAHRLSE